MKPHDSDRSALAPPELPQTTPKVGSNGNALDNHGQEGDTEELNYNPVRPKKTVHVSVRYRIRGRGQPLPYPLDEEDGQ